MIKLRIKLLLGALVGFSMLAVDSLVPTPIGSFVSTAHAVVGRPATPGSVAGVARRTTRRVIRRSSIYVATLPAGCARTSVNGTVVWSCGGTYYQPYGGRYVVVYID
ncbi:hypothetical protein MesoLjLc_09680 [Mesorhizobium sp. L-8-10]|nr:hypothetical protein MesoLjLc_09680 [Mesorhizobium sp. L-8-10]